METNVRVLSSAAEVDAAVGVELGPGPWFPVGQERIDGFAEATEDRQWIHVDPPRAAGGPFGGAIAHGFLTLSLVPFLLSGVRRFDNTTMSINYGLERVRFPTPVRSGSRVRVRAVLQSAALLADGAVQVVTRATVEVEGAPKPACVADVVTRTHFAES